MLLARQKKLLQLLDEFDMLSISEILLKLEASPATVRRDLTDLAKKGLIVRSHGGAMKAKGVPTSLTAKKSRNQDCKDAIGKIAAAQICSGDVVFMDCGSTVLSLCRYLKSDLSFRLITNSLAVVAALEEHSQVRISLIGGELDRLRQAVHGNMAVNHINQYHADKAFIGTDGLNVTKGLSAHTESEASITRAICENAEQVYLLCDSSKIDVEAYIRTGPLTMCHYLVADRAVSPEFIQRITETGVKILQSTT